MNKEPIIFIFQFYGIQKYWEDPVGKVLSLLQLGRGCEDLGSYTQFPIEYLFQNIQLIAFIAR